MGCRDQMESGVGMAWNTQIGFGINLDEYMKQFCSEKVTQFVNSMFQGEKFPLPFLDYSTNRFEQEGRHRVYAAYILGIDKVPVLIVMAS